MFEIFVYNSNLTCPPAVEAKTVYEQPAPGLKSVKRILT